MKIINIYANNHKMTTGFENMFYGDFSHSYLNKLFNRVAVHISTSRFIYYFVFRDFPKSMYGSCICIFNIHPIWNMTRTRVDKYLKKKEKSHLWNLIICMTKLLNDFYTISKCDKNRITWHKCDWKNETLICRLYQLHVWWYSKMVYMVY